jgi:hypothetical protein
MCIRINIFALLTVAMITTTTAQSASRTFEDSMGRDIGRATTHGNTTTFRDNFGRRPLGAVTAQCRRQPQRRRASRCFT